jgi:4-hydroxy-4-methyl-2-oxoglutarate aldolase
MMATLSRRTSLLSDALDRAGRRNQCLGPDIVPLSGEHLQGRAFPFVLQRVDRPAEPSYRGLLAALDAVPANSVVVIPGGRATDAALFGELMATACLARGAAGAVCEGFVRDLDDVRALGFPLFACGTVPYDMDGRLEVVGHDRPVEIDGVTIEPGVLIVADEDGVVVVPHDVEEEVLAAAADKAAKESGFKEAVASGLSPSEAYERFGVL